MRLLHEPTFLSATIGKIYDCALQPERWRDVMPEFDEAIGARRAFFGIGKPSGDFNPVVIADESAIGPDIHQHMHLSPIMPLGMV